MISTRPRGIWPAPPPRTPWQPGPPAAPPPAAPSTVTVRPLPARSPQWLIVDSGRDWLDERLLDRRMVSLSGRLDAAATNRAAASLAVLDASGDDPIELRMYNVEADLDIALTLLDTVDLVGVPLHATCLGELHGAAVVILAVADHRAAGPHATLHLREPSTHLSGHADNVATHAEDHRHRLHLLQQRIAGACHRTVDAVAADMRKGRILTAEQARGYGLVDVIADGRSRRASARPVPLPQAPRHERG